MGEYMIKNFEAMACGCILLAYRQGEGEEEALGFSDMNNIVLYSSIAELREKLAQLRANPERAEQIAHAGQDLVTTRYTFEAIGKIIVEETSRPLALRPPLNLMEKLRSRFCWIP